MKTRSFFMVAIIATMFVTACSDQQVVQLKTGGQEISFRLQGGMPETTTRALATTTDNLEAFVVYGTDNVLAVTNDLLFKGVTVARQLGSTSPAVFTYAPKVYYSDGATNAGFFAFAPVSANIVNNSLNYATFFTSGASFDYTVPAPDGSGDAIQEDLLVALTAPVTPSATPVSLEFKHALARIFVTAENETPDPVIIKSLTLKNLYRTGRLAINLSGWNWTLLTNEGDYGFVLAESGVAVPSTTPPDKPYVTSMEQGMLILPQLAKNIGADDVYDTGDFALEVIYDLANLKGQTKHIVIYDTATSGEWKFNEGEQYRINIKFTGTAIEFEITVLPFDTSIIDVTTM